ncbi:hypothetical protein D0851_16870 [Marinobacter sp. Arc7-DN-1]|nr:hypothetical protein D0851_16870 [Marinobacter sp. Arc7-DN-1]
MLERDKVGEIMKRYLIAGVLWGLAGIPLADALEKPIPYSYWDDPVNLDARKTQLKHITFFWQDSGKGLREPSPKLLDWYQREEAFYRDHFFEDTEEAGPRVYSFLRSEEYAHIQMYYATQRIENILGAIASTQEERDSKRELFAWIALTAETQRCQELIEFADHLLRVKEIGASTQQAIKEFCRFAPLRLHRSVILPFYQQMYLK